MGNTPPKELNSAFPKNVSSKTSPPKAVKVQTSSPTIFRTPNDTKRRSSSPFEDNSVQAFEELDDDSESKTQTPEMRSTNNSKNTFDKSKSMTSVQAFEEWNDENKSITLDTRSAKNSKNTSDMSKSMTSVQDFEEWNDENKGTPDNRLIRSNKNTPGTASGNKVPGGWMEAAGIHQEPPEGS